MGVQLTDEEIWQFVADSHTGILTTIDRQGFPVSLPTWHVVIDERVYVRTREKAAKSRRIAVDSRVSFLVESGEYWVDLKAVCLIGHAHHVTDEELRAAVLTALDDKYGGFRKSRREMP